VRLGATRSQGSESGGQRCCEPSSPSLIARLPVEDVAQPLSNWQRYCGLCGSVGPRPPRWWAFSSDTRSVVCLVGSVLMETNDEWQVGKRYFSLASMKKLEAPASIQIAEPIALRLVPVLRESSLQLGEALDEFTPLDKTRPPVLTSHLTQADLKPRRKRRGSLHGRIIPLW